MGLASKIALALLAEIGITSTVCHADCFDTFTYHRDGGDVGQGSVNHVVGKIVAGDSGGVGLLGFGAPDDGVKYLKGKPETQWTASDYATVIRQIERGIAGAGSSSSNPDWADINFRDFGQKLIQSFECRQSAVSGDGGGSGDQATSDGPQDNDEPDQATVARKIDSITNSSSDDVLAGLQAPKAKSKSKSKIKTNDLVKQDIATLNEESVTTLWAKLGCETDEGHEVCELLSDRKKQLISGAWDQKIKAGMELAPKGDMTSDRLTAIEQQWKRFNCDEAPSMQTCKDLEEERQGLSPITKDGTSAKVNTGTQISKTAQSSSCKVLSRQGAPCVTWKPVPHEYNTYAGPAYEAAIRAHNSCDTAIEASASFAEAPQSGGADILPANMAEGEFKVIVIYAGKKLASLAFDTCEKEKP